MGTTRRLFTDEFKREAVELLASSGRPLSQVAGELGIAASMLRALAEQGVTGRRQDRRVTRQYAGGDPACRSGSAAENARLRRENERLRMEREILKKTHL